MEEYAREVFPLEEAANGLKWMEEDGDGGSSSGGYAGADGNANSDGLCIGVSDALEMDQGDKREGKVASGTTGGGITTSSKFGGSC